MKTNYSPACAILALLSPLSGAYAAQNTLDNIPHWANDAQKTVYYVPRPLLKVEVDNLAADEKHWDHLTVDLSYDDAQITAQTDALTAAYPGYQLSRPILERQSNYVLSIPLLKVNATVNVLPNATGPYFHWEAYIDHAQSGNLRAALANGTGTVSVTGTVGADVPTPTVVEHQELDPSVCTNLLKGKGSVRDLLNNYGGVLSQIDGLNLQYASTRSALIDSVFQGCFRLPTAKFVSSVSELLDISLQNANSGFRPVGETTQWVNTLQTVTLYYDQTQILK